jgi:hypothetical protein
VNDKRVEEDGERQKFSSRILPAYARRSPKVGEVIPILYLRGLSTGDFRPALEGLLGEDAAGLSAITVSRLCKEWEAHHDRLRQRLLSFNRYAYLSMDGIHVQVRLGEDPKLCLLIVIGVREDGVKELLAVEDGYRESTESWSGVFRDLKRRGLNEPKLVVGARPRLDAADRVLRLPRRALAAPTNHEPDRELVRHSAPAHQGHEGRRPEDRRAGDGLQAAGVSAGTLATVQRPRARRRRARRREVQGRHQGHRGRHQRQRDDRREGRRLIILHCQTHNI